MPGDHGARSHPVQSRRGGYPFHGTPQRNGFFPPHSTRIIEGLHLGSNTQAAYITRALAEIKRLGKALGARETTFMGLSGIGDLVLTCTGPLSRNRMFGIELARGRKAAEILHSQKAVVEGYYTVDAAYRLSTTLNVEMPITEQLYQIIYHDKDAGKSLEEITRRAFKEEDA